LHDLIRAFKIVQRQADRGESKGLEGGQDALGIGRMRLHEDIKISGETWYTVKGEGVPADNQVLNVTGVE
jgi:hypothetical protein